MPDTALQQDAVGILTQVLAAAARGTLSYADLTLVGERLAQARNLGLAEELYLRWTERMPAELSHVACADMGDILREAGQLFDAERWYRKSLVCNGGYERARAALQSVRLSVYGTVSRWPVAIHNIELTNRCPMKCVMCPRTQHMTRDQGFMEFDVFRSIIDQLVESNPASLSQELLWLHHFGESLTHPDFDTFINYAADRGARVGLSLNPLVVKGAVADKLLKSRLDTIYASLDGHDDETFAKIRGIDNAYEKSKRNLLALVEKKKELNWSTKVIVSMINFPMNAESIAGVTEFWREIEGVDDVLAKDFTAWNGDADDVNELKPDAAKPKPYPFTRCLTPWKYLSIAWDGDVVPCCFDYDKKLVLGNVKTQSLDEIWNGRAMQDLRLEFITDNVTNPLCRTCPSL